MLSRYKIIFSFVLITLIFTLTGCGTQGENATNESENTSNYASSVTEKPIVTITMENDEKI